MAKRSGFARRPQVHIILVPGFGAFDALGQVQYYSGITTLFRHWREQQKRSPVVLHYFDNLPTAAVSTRASRLRAYIAKRMARGEILDDDSIVLVGHSTGGLDIRRLICDLHSPRPEPLYVDGGESVSDEHIRHCLKRVVFLSVPHWGTNIADWVCSHPGWRAVIIAKLRAAVTGSQLYLLDQIESGITGCAASLTNAEIFLALQDALTEANQNYGKPGPTRTADALEAASELTFYFRQMSTDFHVINDLTSQPHEPTTKSPAHFDDKERETELELWDDPQIRVLSFATVGGRPFCFPAGVPAPVWELANPFSYPEFARDLKLSAKTDLAYRLVYRACAGGPFRWPRLAGKISLMLDPTPPLPLQIWDNDGIVNTASMLWPRGEIVLVPGDHLDIVGHYQLIKALPHQHGGSGYQPARMYWAYDTLQSTPRFNSTLFNKVWTEIFNFSTNVKTLGRSRRVPAKPPKAAAVAA
ncbi:MAG TPA: hypothetical protein VEG30_14895 [Terriglobales bacterium]|nr:hypothetical protein [Terriglobales bacterium]